MQRKTSFVSVIIPAYNASAFLEETLNSIFTQSFSNWEVIVVDDGSTDATIAICEEFNTKNVRVIRQQNAGVAVARNNGLLNSKGEYVVFFDADDLMSPGFLSERVSVLDNEKEIGFVGGLVETFPLAAKMRMAAGSDPVNQILFFDAAFVTIPSNYLFRKDILIKNNIFFNKQLSSSADRFFILEVAKFAKGTNLSSENGKLLYRFTSQSMSNHVTPGLIIDNEKFYYELKRKKLLPDGRKHKFNSFYFLSLAKGFGMVKSWKMVLKYLIMSFFNHPVFFTANFGKSLSKASSLKA